MPPPATRPSIEVDGHPHAALNAALLALEVADTGEGPSVCRARFSNWGRVGRGAGFQFFDRRILDFGTTIRVLLSGVAVFDGRILGIDADFDDTTAPTIGVRAADRLIDLRATPRTRTFVEMSDREIVQQIAAGHGMTAQVHLPGPTHALVAQLNQTDLDFLCGRLSPLDAWMRVEQSVLHAAPRTVPLGETITLTRGVELTRFSVAADLDGQCTRITMAGWDAVSKEPLGWTSDATAPGEAPAGLTAAALLRAAFGDREDTIVLPACSLAEEVRGRADAHLLDRAGRFVTGHGVCSEPRLRAGVHVDLHGLGPLFSGQYRVADVRHQFDATHGTRTSFSARSAAIGPR
jgi:uncharacterized protein